ncbi:hypothetical protein AB1K42_11185 [Roseibium algicola]|uniref:hypothetical protein n=1 Tax=Roseibium algicola TaxID=2857014 RepID=UPI003459B00E
MRQAIRAAPEGFGGFSGLAVRLATLGMMRGKLHRLCGQVRFHRHRAFQSANALWNMRVGCGGCDPGKKADQQCDQDVAHSISVPDRGLNFHTLAAHKRVIAN